MKNVSIHLQARPLLIHAVETGDCSQLIDPKLERNFVESEMRRMVEAAAACIRHSAPKRPRMIQVLLRDTSLFNKFPSLFYMFILWLFSIDLIVFLRKPFILAL